ncbi:hypothetical protein ACK8OX_20550, partial [Falsiroseomonas sp. CW058]
MAQTGDGTGDWASRLKVSLTGGAAEPARPPAPGATAPAPAPAEGGLLSFLNAPPAEGPAAPSLLDALNAPAASGLLAVLAAPPPAPAPAPAAPLPPAPLFEAIRPPPAAP